MAQANPYPLRIDQSVMDKIKATAQVNGRSTNKEIEFALRLFIADFEKQHGTIDLPKG